MRKARVPEPTHHRRQSTLQPAVLDNLENAPWLGATLADLGRKHVDYGVTEVMYDWVGDALLDTLCEVAGDARTDECAAAWTEAYGVIASAMKAGAAPRTTASSSLRRVFADRP